MSKSESLATEQERLSLERRDLRNCIKCDMETIRLHLNKEDYGLAAQSAGDLQAHIFKLWLAENRLSDVSSMLDTFKRIDKQMERIEGT